MNIESLLSQHKALLTGRWITDLSNTSAFIFSEVADLNWAGFYLLEDNVLILGPFQGKPACTEIPLSKGVCGAAARTRTVMRVDDVHSFESHITCDPASRSELVVPLILNGELVGVMDIDSPTPSRFTELEERLFAGIAAQLLGTSTLLR